MRFIEIDGELTEEIKNGMLRANYYLDGSCEFAMLSENVFVVLEETKVSDGLDKVRNEVVQFVDEVLSNPPDFTPCDLDDGYKLVLVYGVYAFEREGAQDDKKADFVRELLLRGELLEACENGKVIAVAAMSDDNE